MNINKLFWLSKEGEEAALTINDGAHYFIVFSHPCQYKEGDSITDELYPFNVEKLMLANNNIEKFEKINDDKFSYKIFAVVKDVKAGLVSVGNIILNLNKPIPGWVSVGDYVEFKCSRIDT